MLLPPVARFAMGLGLGVFGIDIPTEIEIEIDIWPAVAAPTFTAPNEVRWKEGRVSDRRSLTAENGSFK